MIAPASERRGGVTRSVTRLPRSAGAVLPVVLPACLGAPGRCYP